MTDEGWGLQEGPELGVRLRDTLEALDRQEEQAWSQATLFISQLSACTVNLDAAFFSLLKDSLDCKTAASEAFTAELTCALVKLRPKETTTALLPEPLWLNRLDSRSLTDTCLALLTQSHFPPCGLQVVSRLIERLNTLEAVALVNACSLLCEYVEKCDLEGWVERLSPLICPESLQRLFALVEYGKDYMRVSALATVKAVIAAGVFPKACGSALEVMTQLYSQAIAVLIRLLEQPCSQTLQFPLGETLERLGPVRLKCVELLAALMALPSLAQAVIATSAFRLCTDLFFDFEWHSLFHHAYFSLVKGALEAGDCPSIAQDSGLPQHLAAAEKEVSRAGKLVRPGNYGYIVRITELLMTSSLKFPLLKQALEGIEGWKDFTSTVIQPRLDIQQKRDFTSLCLSPFPQQCPLDEEDECEYELKDEPEEGNCNAFDSAHWKVQ